MKFGIVKLGLFLLQAWSTLAIHVYVDSNEKKCFHEDLPAGTHLVVSYKAELYEGEKQSYVQRADTIVKGLVTHVASAHTIVDQKGSDQGKFRITSSESGDHSICLTVRPVSYGNTRVKLFFDIQFGEDGNTNIKETRQNELGKVIDKAQDIKTTLSLIRSELAHQREREAEFRAASERVNTAAVRWTIIQMVILGVTASWQLRHLGQFFVKKKIV